MSYEHRLQYPWARIGSLPRAQPGLQYRISLGQCVCCADRGSDRCACGGDQFTFYRGDPQRQSVFLYDVQDGGHGYGQDAVLAADSAVSFTEAGDDNVCDFKGVQADGGADDIHNGIHGTHLVEMYLVYGDAVGFGLRLGQDTEDLLGQRFGSRGHICLTDDRDDLCESPMLMVVSVVRMVPGKTVTMEKVHVVVMVFMGFVQQDVEITGIQPVLFHTGDLDLKTFYRQAVQCLHKNASIGAQVQEGSHGHVPADPGLAF